MSPPASLARGVTFGDLAALACVEGGGPAENAGKNQPLPDRRGLTNQVESLRPSSNLWR